MKKADRQRREPKEGNQTPRSLLTSQKSENIQHNDYDKAVNSTHYAFKN